MFLSEYPGLERGLARLQRVGDVLRTFAMTPLLERINGLSVRQLTPRHVDLLLLISSPFLISAEKRREFRILIQSQDVARFLWIVSPVNPLDGTPPPPEFFKTLRPNEPGYFQQFYRAIDRYLERAMFDRPDKALDGQVVATSLSASTVNRVAGAYGWPDEVMEVPEPPLRTRLWCWLLRRPWPRLSPRPVMGAGIMDMPIARLYQYIRWIKADRNPSAALFDKYRDACRDRRIMKWRGRAKAAGFEDDPSFPGRHREGVYRYLMSIRKITSPQSAISNLQS